jgi:WD40-like Beta Propeller Repeat/Omp85 superfamily domain
MAGDPELDWWTIETTHFRVHYDRPLEPIAARVAALAETIQERVTGSLGYAPRTFTEIVLTDDTDSANGSATALPYNIIRLYVTAPEDLSTLGDYDDWYLELLTHEYTHVAHIDNISGLPAVVNAVIGKTVAPNQVQPRWIIEGLAVVSESEHTSAGRIRSSLFDMFLRADVLDDHIAGLDQFSSSPVRWPQGNLWYLYGSRFLRWITDVYGPSTMRAVAADYGSWILPWGINRSIRRATGSTYVELYEGFKDHLRRRYAEQMRAVEARGLREGARLTHHGRNVLYPRFVPRAARRGEGEELLYYRDDFDERSGVYRLPLDAPKGEELVARAAGATTSAFTPEGDLVFNSAAVFRNLYYRDDLFRLPRGQVSREGDEAARRRLTVGLRASYADVSPDGARVAFVVNTKGTTYLEIADVGPDGALRNRRDLVPSARFEQAYTPRFSPDGRSVAYSAWTAGGYRDVRVVDVATGRFREVTHDRALDMNPVYSPDGRTLYFASDRTGIFNIHAYDVASGALAQVTNVKTGAVEPAVSADGKTLVYVGYTSLGYDLFAMPLDRARFLAAVPAPNDRADPPTEPNDVPLHKGRYNPLPTLAPRSYTASVAPGKYEDYALTLSARGSDVVGLHSLAASLTVEPLAPAPSLTLDYGYGRLPVDVGMRFFRSVTPRSGYFVNDVKRPYDELTTGLTAGVTYNAPQDFATHSLGVSFSVATFYGVLPFGPSIDPSSVVRADPPRGNINVAHIGYSFSNVESGVETAGPTRGFSLQLGLDYADAATGSNYSIYALNGAVQAYLPMPWPGHHTLALRMSGAVGGGTYPRTGAYSVGGYDLAGNGPVATILSGVFNGTFALRGYPARLVSGSEYLLQNIEYRAPLFTADRGLSTLPLYLRRLDGALFFDWGGAFNRLRVEEIALFKGGQLIYAPQLHSSIGAELWISATLGYVITTQLRLGYAYGLSPVAIPHGQPYFIAQTAF